MGLGSTFWSNIGASALWHDMTTLASGFNAGTSGVFRSLVIGPCKIYQEPVTMGGIQSRVQDNPGFDAGYFYALELVSSGGVEKTPEVRIWADAIFLTGHPRLHTVNNGQWVFLEPYFKHGDLTPGASDASISDPYDKNPVYKTGFVHGYDASKPPYQYPGPPLTNQAFWLQVQNVVGYWRLWHYSPWAWSGTVPEVIASAAMHAGLSEDNIDQTAFDSAHDSYDLTTGDPPWKDLDTKWTIYAPRIVGERVIDFLVKCADHSRDLLFINEAGKLSISSRTNPDYATINIDLEGDQVISVLEWGLTEKHLFNTVKAGWGFAARQSWEDTDGFVGTRPGITEQAVSLDPTLSGGPVDKWVHEKEDTSSVGLFGRAWLKGKKTLSNFRGIPQETEISHYPFLLTPHVTCAGYTSWDPAADGGGMVHVTHWLASDSKIRKEVKMKQGPMGFQTGIGDLILNLAITADGSTIAWARVIEKTYDFDSLTMTSTILETPPNT